MVKGLIWFSDIDLYNKCEIEARRLGISCATDYISFQVEKYLEEIDPKYAPKKIITKKSGEEKEKKYFRNNVDVWLALKDQAIIQNMTVSGLMEHICGQILTNKPDVLTPAPLLTEQLQNIQGNEPVKSGGGYTIDPPWKFRKE